MREDHACPLFRSQPQADGHAGLDNEFRSRIAQDMRAQNDIIFAEDELADTVHALILCHSFTVRQAVPLRCRDSSVSPTPAISGLV